MRTEGILDGGGSSTAGGGAASWAARENAGALMRLGAALFWTRARCGVEDWRAGERCENERGRATGAREREDGEQRGIGKDVYRVFRNAEGESRGCEFTGSGFFLIILAPLKTSFRASLTDS